MLCEPLQTFPKAGESVMTMTDTVEHPARSAVGAIEPRTRTESIGRCFGADRSDEALVSAIGQGDQHAMTLLYDRHHSRVYRFALRLTRDSTLAEDIVSDVFLDVWRHADGFRAKAQVSTWLLGIARHKSFSAIKRRSNEHPDGQPIEMTDPADDPELVVHKKDRSKLIQRCLWQLSAVHREVIDLVYYHDKSIAEVAEIVGAPAGTVKTRMFHARQRLGALLVTAHGCI
jgi:RNA polymerase sigma-70 factor (ECF subfamily)